jgi:hypothetical protein
MVVFHLNRTSKGIFTAGERVLISNQRGMETYCQDDWGIIPTLVKGKSLETVWVKNNYLKMHEARHKSR